MENRRPLMGRWTTLPSECESALLTPGKRKEKSHINKVVIRQMPEAGRDG